MPILAPACAIIFTWARRCRARMYAVLFSADRPWPQTTESPSTRSVLIRVSPVYQGSKQICVHPAQICGQKQTAITKAQEAKRTRLSRKLVARLSCTFALFAFIRGESL